MPLPVISKSVTPSAPRKGSMQLPRQSGFLLSNTHCQPAKRIHVLPIRCIACGTHVPVSVPQKLGNGAPTGYLLVFVSPISTAPSSTTSRWWLRRRKLPAR